MADPIVNVNDPSNQPGIDTEPVADPSYNPLLAAMLATEISVSTALTGHSSIESGSPRLSSGEEMYRKVQLAWSNIITEILDSWGENNKAIEERRKEAQKKEDKIDEQVKADKIARDKETKKLDRATGAVDPLTTRDIWQNGMASLFSLYLEDAQKARGVDPSSSAGPAAVGAPSGTGSVYVGDLGGVQPSSEMTSALIIAAGFVGSFKTAEVSGAPQLDNKILQDAWSQIAVGHNPNDQVTQVAGWVSALWGIGLTYFTAAKEVGEIASTNKEPAKDLEFAVKYAENLIAALATPEFMAQIKVIVVANTKPSEQVDPKQTETLGMMGKIVLLTVALAQIMKLEMGASFKDKVYEGHLTGDEVVAMLKGEINFQTNDPYRLAPTKAKLIVQINVLMDQLPVDVREALMGNMLAHFNKNPAVEKMSNINRVIADVFSSNNMGEEHLQQNPI